MSIRAGAVLKKREKEHGLCYSQGAFLSMLTQPKSQTPPIMRYFAIWPSIFNYGQVSLKTSIKNAGQTH